MVGSYGTLGLLFLLSLANGSVVGSTTTADDAGFAAETATASQHREVSRRRRSAEAQGSTDQVRCRVMQVDVEWGSPDADEALSALVDAETTIQHRPSYACWTNHDEDKDQMVLDLRPCLPAQEQMIAMASRRHVIITRAAIDVGSASVWLTPESEILLDDDYSENEEEDGNGPRRHVRRRELAPKEGTNPVLVVRVTYKGASPSLTSAQLAGRVFGIGPNAEPNSLVSQVSACSFGKLRLVPGSGHAAFKDGVIDVSISTPVSGDTSSRALENLVQAALTTLLGSSMSSYKHTMMVFPNHPDILSSGRTFLAYGYLGGSRTVFTDQWAGRLTAILHEFGHNWNLSHSGKGSDRYGDLSGLMGYGSRLVGGPVTCFNAQKHWDLGWLGTKAKSLAAGSGTDLPWSGNLAPFVDFPRATSSQVVVVRILGSNQRLFLQYNRKKGINAGTRELPDQVVIVQDDGTDNQSGLQSWQLGGIVDVGSSFRRQGFSGGRDLVVEVCSKDMTSSPESVRLSIYLDDGVQRSTCTSSGATPIATNCVEFPSDEFFVEAKSGARTCLWLQRRPKWQALLCKQGSDAYEVCPATCKARC